MTCQVIAFYFCTAVWQFLIEKVNKIGVFMTPFFFNVPWRDWISFANNATNSKQKRPNIDALPKSLSTHLARDIGISDSDLERLRHQWPSETALHSRW